MTPREIVEANPFFRAMKARDTFTATYAVALLHWRQLDEASGWCEGRWREYSQHYRRRVHSASRQAIFEFQDFEYATEFLLKFGLRCWRI